MRIRRNQQQISVRGEIALHELVDESEFNSTLFRANVVKAELSNYSDHLISINAAADLHVSGEYDSSVDSFNSGEHLFYFRIQNPEEVVELRFRQGVIDVGQNGKNHLDLLFKLADSLDAELLSDFGRPLDKPIRKKKFLGLF